MNKILKFKCPHCGHHRAEEVMVDVTVSTPVCQIELADGNWQVEYDYSGEEKFDGRVDRYQCAKCGFIVPAGSIEALAASECMHEVKE